MMSHSFQKGLSFQSIESFLSYLPDDQLQITSQLRNIILETLPHAKEKLSYNVPFYSLKKRICFIWPGEIPWGGTREGVLLGFNYGNQLGHDGYLEAGNRKQVFTKLFQKPSDINKSIIERLLLESELLDRG